MSGAGSSTGRSDERGFTLIELLVVVGILALLLIIAAPLAGRTRAGMELRSAALDIASSLRDARSAARLGNSEQSLVLDLGGRRMWTEGQAVRRPLPRHFAMTLDIPAAEQIGANAGRVRFFPDGSASGGRIVLREAGRTATVSINWLTGDVDVHWSR